MPNELYEFLQPIALEGIKILGPAAIAAVVAYKAATIQIELKLRELESQNAFRAREAIFNHLREKLVHIDQQSQKLNQELGQLLGFAAAESEIKADASPSEYVKIMAVALEPCIRTAPMEARSLVSQMRLAGLGTSEEYTQLTAWQATSHEGGAMASFNGLKHAVLSMLEVYELMGACTRRLLEHQLERVFSPYVQSRPKQP
jgi:hypothetical protein